MLDNKNHLISQINLAQLCQLETEDISFNKELVELEIDQLTRPSYSLREQNPDLILTLAKSLMQYDFLGGIFVTEKSNRVIDGWHRSQLWKELGKTNIPCYIVSCTAEQERRLHLNLNIQAAAFSAATFGVEFKNINLEDFGLSSDDYNNNLSLEPKFPSSQNQPEPGLTKLSTTIPIETYDQIKAIKKQTDAKSISDAIVGVSEICYTLFRGKLTTCFAGKEMQHMLQQHKQR